MHGAALGLCQPHGRWQADEPQAVAVAEQAAGPQLGVGVEPLGHLVRQLHLLLDPFFVFFLSDCKSLTVKDDVEEAELAAAHARTHKHTQRTCLVLLASRAGLLDRLAPAALLLSAGRSSRARSNSSLRSRGKLLYLQDRNISLGEDSVHLLLLDK